MADLYKNIEIRIELTIQDILIAHKKREHLTIVKKTQEYNINRFHILYRLKKIELYINKKLKNNQLLEIQKQVFLRYNLSLNKIKRLIYYNEISKIINNIFKANNNSILTIN